MKKLFIALIVLGIIAIGISANADSTRVINHKFRAITSNVAPANGGGVVLSAGTIYRITGYATANSGVFAIYDAAAIADILAANCAVEGGEATSGDPLPVYDFGEEGLTLSTGMTVVTSGCTIVLEYL